MTPILVEALCGLMFVLRIRVGRLSQIYYVSLLQSVISSSCQSSLLPMPGARDDGVEIAIVRAPSKLVMGAPGIGHQPRRIAGAPRPDSESNLSTGHPGDRSDDFPDRMAATV